MNPINRSFPAKDDGLAIIKETIALSLCSSGADHRIVTFYS